MMSCFSEGWIQLTKKPNTFALCFCDVIQTRIKFTWPSLLDRGWSTGLTFHFFCLGIWVCARQLFGQCLRHRHATGEVNSGEPAAAVELFMQPAVMIGCFQYNTLFTGWLASQQEIYHFSLSTRLDSEIDPFVGSISWSGSLIPIKFESTLPWQHGGVDWSAAGSPVRLVLFVSVVTEEYMRQRHCNPAQSSGNLVSCQSCQIW